MKLYTLSNEDIKQFIVSIPDHLSLSERKLFKAFRDKDLSASQRRIREVFRRIKYDAEQ